MAVTNKIGDNTVFLYFPTTDKFNAKKLSIPATSVTFIADTGQIYANGTMFGGNTTTPKAHAAESTTYGGATADLYGHVKLFDMAGTQKAKDSAAATPYALSAVSTSLGSRISTAESGISDLSTALKKTDGRIGTDVINYLSAGTGMTVINNTDSSGKKYGTISVKAKATDVSASVGGTTSRVYAVGVDKNGDLAVKVDWSVYTHPSHTAINKSSTWLTGITVDSFGHVTAVTNSSLPTASTSAAGIVKLTDSSVSTATDTAPTASALNAVNTAAKNAANAASAAQATANNKGVIDKVEANDVSAGITATTSGKDVKLSLKMSDTKNAVGKIGTGKVYGVGIDSSGYLAVSVPWQNDNTVYTHPSHTAYNLNTSGKFISGLTVDSFGHVTAAAESSLPTASTSAAGIVKLTDSSVSTATDTAPTASALNAVNTAAKNAANAASAAQATANGKGIVNTVFNGDGITVTNGSSANVTVKANLGNTTKLTIDTTKKVYGVGVDASGKLAVSVPWTDTLTNSAISLTGDVTGSGTSSIATTIADNTVTSKKIKGFTNSASDFTADASVKVPSAAAVKSFVEGKGYVTSSGVTEIAGGAGISVSGGTTSKATVSHNTSGVTAGTYRCVTVDTFGHVTKGSNPTTISGYGLTDAVSKNGDIMTGNLYISTDLSKDKGFVVDASSTQKMGLIVGSSSKNAGLYDFKNNKWILCESESGTVTLNGNATTATTASVATTANKLGTNAGSATKPVYFSGGVPVAGTYTLASACEKTAGPAAGNVPVVGTALGTADNVPVVTNTSGQLKPHVSGALKSAAFKDASTTVSSSDGIIPTGSAVVNYVTSAVNAAVADLAKALKYESVVTSESGLASSAKGAVYFANGAFTLSAAKSSTGVAQTLEKGDMLIGDGTGKFGVVNANWTAVDGSSALQWGQTVTLATIGGVTIDAQLPAAAPSGWGLSNFATKFWKKTDAALSGTITLNPNTMYVWSSAFTGDVILNQGTAISGIVNEYCGRFTAGSGSVTFTGVTMWNEDRPDIVSGSTYEFSIIDNYGILTKLKTF